MKRFRRGLVVGKFSPLHRGHEAVIRRALEACDEVIVLSYSKPEFAGCEAARRAEWLAELFPDAKRLVVTEDLEDRIELPANDAPDGVHRDFCASLLENHFGVEVDAVFTSEDYGDGFAEHLTRRFREKNPRAAAVEHVSVDRDRVNVPVSGTLIRTDVHEYRRWLSPCVYASFVQRVCLLGGESSGKTVLARALSERFDTPFVAEYGRELWEAKGGALVYEDLLAIGLRQVELERFAARRADRYLICDTSPLTTLFYSLDMFARADPELHALATRPYDHYVLCAPDFEFVQDGSRRDAAFRQRQHQWYIERLERAGIPYLLAEGTVENRVTRVAGKLANQTGL